jgi:hypothetical protein
VPLTACTGSTLIAVWHAGGDAASLRREAGRLNEANMGGLRKVCLSDPLPGTCRVLLGAYRAVPEKHRGVADADALARHQKACTVHAHGFARRQFCCWAFGMTRACA